MLAIIPWILTGLFTILWIFSFIHCIRHPKIYRPFNAPSIVVKIVWIAFLFTFSPFALIAYLIFGLLVKDREDRSSFVHVFSLIVLAVCVFLALPQMPVQDKEAHFVREEAEWREVSDSPEKPWKTGLNAEFHLGVIEARTNLSTTSSTSHSGNATLAARRIAIALDSEHPLIEKATDNLIEGLKKISYIESIELIPFGKQYSPGGVLPDAWIRLHMPQISVTQLPPQLKIDARIVMTMGVEPFNSTHSYHESYSLPVVSYGLTCELSHQSKTTAIGTGRTKYKLAAKDIGKELIKAVQNLFDGHIEKYGLMPTEIDRFIPQWENPPEPPLAILKDKTPVIDGVRPLTNNAVLWVLEADEDISTTFERFIPEMKEQGWTVQHNRLHEEHSKPYLRFSKDEERLIVFVPKRPMEAIVTPDAKKQYVISYTRQMPKDQVTAELKQVLDDDPPIQFLMMMKDWLRGDRDMQSRFLHILENSRDSRPGTYLEIASLLGSLDEREKQWMALQKANTVEKALGSEPSKQSSIDSAIKKFKKDHSDLVVEISKANLYESFGLQPMPSTGEVTLSGTVRLHEPVAVYRISDDGKVETVAAFMVRSPFKNNPSPYALRLRHCKNGSSMSTSGANRMPGDPEKFQWECNTSNEGRSFQAKSITEEDNRFLIELKISPNK